MIARKATVLAAVLLALPAIAAAQTTTKAAVPTTSDGRIGVAQALEAAKEHIDGGVLEAELETEGEEQIWEVDVASGDSVHEVKVNAMSGAVISADEKTIEGTWRSWFDADSLADSQRISSTLAATIAKVEGEADGRITALELDEHDGKLIYEMEIETADGERDMLLDPATGAVTPEN